MVNFTLNMQKQNLFLGANGAGKSSVFHVIHILTKFVAGEGRVSDYFSPLTLTRWQSQNVQTFELELGLAKDTYEYHLEIEYEISTGKSKLKKEWVKYNGNLLINASGSSAQLFNDQYEQKSEILMDWTFSAVGLIQERYENKKLISFKKEMQKIIVCSPIPCRMHDQTKAESLIPELNFDNMAAVFRHVAQEYPDCMAHLFGILREALPGFIRLRIQGEPDAESEKTLKVEFELNNSKIDFRFGELSDGEKMLTALYILTFCYLQNGYSIFLDEADNYIALSEIQPMLSTIEDFCGNNAQYAMISHNANTIDYFAPNQIIWFYKGGDGVVRTADRPNVGAEIYTSSQILERGLNIAE